MPRPLAEAEEAQIAAGYDAGATIAQVARKHKIADKRVIAVVLARVGRIRPRGYDPQPIAVDLVAEIVDLYRDEQLTIVAISRRFHLKAERVRGALLDAGVELRRYQLNRPTQLDAAQRAALAAGYLAGATLDDLKARYRCGEPTVSAVLARQGVPIRSNPAYAGRARRGRFAPARSISA